MTPTPQLYPLNEYETWLRSWNAADRTLEARMILSRKLATIWPDPRAVTDEDVTVFLSDASFSKWTRATYFGHIRSLFGWLAEDGRIDADPTSGMRRPGPPANRPRPLSVLEANRARAEAVDPDLHLMLLLGMLAGLRAHETAKIHSSHVTEDELYVRGKGGKESVLPTHPLIWQAAQDRSGFWFPGLGSDHVSGHTVSLRVSALFGSLGIEGSYHRCRHYFGTSLLRAGVNIRVVQELMRHASLATTAAYLGVDDDEKRAGVMSLAA